MFNSYVKLPEGSSMDSIPQDIPNYSASSDLAD